MRPEQHGVDPQRRLLQLGAARARLSAVVSVRKDAGKRRRDERPGPQGEEAGKHEGVV